MDVKSFLSTYFKYALIAVTVYSITVVVFLLKEQYQSIWILYIGNVLYMLTVALIIYFHNRQQHFSESPLTSAVSGHILSLTGAVLSVIVALLLYFLFSKGIFGGQLGEVLKHSPAVMSNTNNSRGMLFILIISAALGNTITGFFAAIFTSFGSSKNKLSERRS